MMPEVLDADQLARERISHETDKDFFVEAGAGSGKTTQLVQRMVAMVKSGIPVGKISAITFTKAAAREFYERFQSALIEETRSSDNDAVSRLQCTQALQDIDLCFMGTIDAFSQQILHEHPAEGGIPSDADVKSDSEMAAIYRREYAKILNGGYGGGLLEQYHAFRSVQSRPQDVFYAQIGEMMELRHVTFAYQPSNIQNVDTAFAAEKASLLQALGCLMQHPGLWGKTQECQKRNALFQKEYSVLTGAWNGQVGNILYILASLDEFRVYEQPDNIGIHDTTLFEPKLSRNKVAYYYLDLQNTSLFNALREYQYAVTMNFLLSAASAIADQLRQNGELSFYDYKLFLRDMLRKDAGGDGKLIRHIADRHSYYLLDEFQDTDPMQAEIFFYLAAVSPVPDWHKCQPRPGSLFIVGDPKQSIYRFRSADVAAFKTVRQLFADGAGEVLQLTRNYRSTVGLKTWFNDRFSSLLSEDTPHQSAFASIPIEGSDDPALLSGVWTYPVEMQRSTMVDDEAMAANVIQHLVGNPAYRIRGKRDAAPRMLRYSDIMVIVRSKKPITGFLREFNSRGIPVRAEGCITFSDCPALCVMTALMEAAGSPYDRMAVYGAMTSPVFGLTDSDMQTLRSHGLYPELSKRVEECEELPETIRTAFRTFRKFAGRVRSMTPSAAFGTLSDSLHLLAKTDTIYLEYFCYALELLRAAETAGQLLSISDGAAFLRNLLVSPEQERCVSLQKDSDRVYIANLHKVKGLEAPVVILAHPRCRAFEPERRTEHSGNGSVCYQFSLELNNTKIAGTRQFPQAYHEEELSMQAEDLRLLYVAATRARNALIIAEPWRENGGTVNMNPWELLLHHTNGHLMDSDLPAANTIRPSGSQADADSLYAAAEAGSILTNSASQKQGYAILRPSQIKLRPVISADDVSEDPTEQSPDEQANRSHAALTGTMVHKLMECLVSASKRPDADSLSESIVRQFGGSAEDAKLLRRVCAKITEGGYPQDNGMCPDILRELETAEAVYCEVPFCHKMQSPDGMMILWNGVMDLLYRKDGKWRIIDYKTNLDGEGLDQKYADQLHAYQEAFQAMTGECAETYIYHIAL